MKLSLKLAISILILAVFSSGLVAITSYFENRDRVDQKTSETIASLVSTVSSMAATAAYANDLVLADEVVSGLALNDEIQCAEIITQLMHRASSAVCIGEASSAETLISPWDAAEVVGGLVIYKSHEYVDALIRQRFIAEVTLLIKVILIISASILIMTHLIIGRPIMRVSDQLDAVNFEKGIDLLAEGSRKDEIGTISKIINMMIANAEKQIIREKMMAHKTEELSNHFRLIFELSKNNLAVTNAQLELQSYNPTFADMVLSLSPEEKLGGSSSWLNCVTNEPEELRDIVDSLVEVNKPVTTQVQFDREENGEFIERYFSLTFVKSLSNDLGISVLFFIYDMTEHHKRLIQSEYEASHDNLTGLFNRRAGTKEIRHLLSAKNAGEFLAIIFIDLDGFKSVNDEFGHDAGDFLLKKVSERLIKIVGTGNVVCRWGGDEFLLALDDATLDKTAKLADDILKSIIEPITLPSGQKCKVGASIGATISSDTKSDFQSLLDHADKAMYKIKKSTKNAVLIEPL